jgi:hypothetical protein
MNSLLFLPSGNDHVEQLIPSVVTGMYLFNGLLSSNNSFIVICCSGKVVTEPLLGNGRLLRFYHSGFQLSCHSIIVQTSTQENRNKYTNITVLIFVYYVYLLVMIQLERNS